MLTDQPSAPLPLRPWWRITILGYAVAAVSVGIVIVAREAKLSQRALDATPLLLAAISIATWFGGVGPGLLAMSLATLAVEYSFIPPIYSWAPGSKDLASLLMFVVSALFFVWVSASRRWAEGALRDARDDMEAAVVERTADLARANDQLRGEIAQRRRTEKELEQLAGRLISAQESERSRIGRELHDHVSQRLGLLAIKLDQLRMASSPPVEAPVRAALDELREQTSEITEDIHGLSHRLHSSMLDHLGLVPALQRLVSECSERYGIPIAFTHNSPARVPFEVSLCLFRLVEEGLSNISKHSRASSARVEVEANGDAIHLTVADEGVGFDPSILETRAGLGFVSMRERLRLVHGTLRVHSAPGQGTRIDVWVPGSGSGLPGAGVRGPESGVSHSQL